MNYAISSLLFLSTAAYDAPADELKSPPRRIECSDTPAITLVNRDGQMLHCVREGDEPYQHIPFPDDRSIWRLPLGMEHPIEPSMLSYSPAAEWPFRSIVIADDPTAMGREHYYLFNRAGVITHSSDAAAVGEQMMEIRLEQARLWPWASVYYRAPRTAALRKSRSFNAVARIDQTSRYSLVVDGGVLCPVLQSRLYSDSEDPRTPPSLEATYLNGHCARAFSANSQLEPHPHGQWLAYPGSSADGLNMIWSIQRHDSPVRPILSRRGNCLAQCDAGGSE
ncbi:hypothetical protein [Stenotrophomonas sp. ESTM1D_MKCIP4_1]|uniref:hypothetical protein n=1 Tax=Stenotrophomonas sp. ESTM1D_MKCIP4_1 TaxID=2072414 RepID=UPI00131F33BC|nr:hypothetical protein [Stenotrophomonas sp. ESTM1D_MKCIP4_1]